MFVARQPFDAPFVMFRKLLVNRSRFLAIGSFGSASFDLLPME